MMVKLSLLLPTVAVIFAKPRLRAVTTPFELTFATELLLDLNLGVLPFLLLTVSVIRLPHLTVAVLRLSAQDVSLMCALSLS